MTQSWREELQKREPYATLDGAVTGRDILAVYDAVVAGTPPHKAVGAASGSDRRVDYALARLKGWGRIRYDRKSKRWGVIGICTAVQTGESDGH